MDYKLYEKDLRQIFRNGDQSFSVCRKWKVVNDDYGLATKADDYDHYCLCKKGYMIPQKEDYCHYCGKSIRRVTLSKPETDALAMKEIRSRSGEVATYYYNYYGGQRSSTLAKAYFVKIHPENESGLLIYKLSPVVKLNKDGEPVINSGIKSVVEVLPGSKAKAYKWKSGLGEEIPIKNGFDLSTSWLNNENEVCFDGAENFVDFINKNPKMAKITGIKECFEKVDTGMAWSKLFISYFYLYCCYPAVELLIKMDKPTIIGKILKSCVRAGSRDALNASIEKLNKLLNPEATKGNQALKIPKYIVDYLYEKDASLTQYEVMCDIYELDDSLSKENFEKISTSQNFYRVINFHQGVWYHEDFKKVPSVMKYGYRLNEVLKYLDKQINTHTRNSERNPGYILQSMEDTARMCDLMQIPLDKFPKDIFKVHDSIAKLFRQKENEMHDEAIGRVKKKYDSIVEKANKNAPDELFIAIPGSSHDIIDEGQQMHNCVGSYITTVARGDTVVFFIRKKEEPQTSFVTAEYRQGGLRQIYYKNNRPVHDEKIRGLAERFCSYARREGLQ